jgi:hypothetical protein
MESVKVHGVTKAFKVNFIVGINSEWFLWQNTNFVKELPGLAKQNNKRSLSRRRSSSFGSLQGGSSGRDTQHTSLHAPSTPTAALTVLCVAATRARDENRLELNTRSDAARKTFECGII